MNTRTSPDPDKQLRLPFAAEERRSACPSDAGTRRTNATTATTKQKQTSIGHNEAFETRRQHQAITATGRPVHQTCCGCIEFYHGCHAWPADKPFACGDYQPVPDATPETTGQPFPPSRMGGRKQPRKRDGAVQGRPHEQGALNRFVRAQCANYQDNGCVYDEPCKVIAGQPCGYFERAVLGPPDYPYKTAGCDWQRLFTQYGQINACFAGRGVAVRRCECGTVLGARERVCAKCRERRRQDTYRQYRAKRHRRATVNGNTPQNS